MKISCRHLPRCPIDGSGSHGNSENGRNKYRPCRFSLSMLRDHGYTVRDRWEVLILLKSEGHASRSSSLWIYTPVLYCSFSFLYRPHSLNVLKTNYWNWIMCKEKLSDYLAQSVEAVIRSTAAISQIGVRTPSTPNFLLVSTINTNV